MQLTELLQQYVETRDMEAASLKPLRAAIKSFSAHLKQPAATEHFKAQVVNAWLLNEVGRVQRRTAKNYRASIITLWKWAFEEEELIEVAPQRVRTIKAPLPPVDAYTPEEVERLLAACDQLSNRFCPHKMVPRKLLYRALILVSFHTGFRPNDNMRLRWSNIAANGCVRIVQHKTKIPVTRWIDRDAMGAIEAVRHPKSDLVFGASTCLETWRAVFARLKEIAGIQRGTPKWIRRAMATAIAVKHGEEAAGAALGQLTAGMARAHYIDQSQILADQLRTPRLRRRKPRKDTG